ncbi:MAG: ABC transporter permease [Clostridium sp.]
MDFIFRGLLSLKKRKGKGLILLAIILIVCLVILSGFGIQSATNASAVLARQKLGAEVSLTQDVQKTMEKMREEQATKTEGVKGRGITRAQVPVAYLDELKNLENVESYSLENSTGANLETGIVAVSSESTTTDLGNLNGAGGQNGNRKPPISMGDVTLIGTNEFSSASEIINGGGELISGSEITEDDLGKNIVMLEEQFATENSLSVGGTMKLKNPETSEEFEVSIVGIYKSNATIDDNAFRNTAMMPYNKIYAPYTLVNIIKGTDYVGKVDSMKFFLDDPVNVDKFIEEGKNTTIDFNTFILDGGTREYEQMMAPIENVASFSKVTLIIVTIFGAAILALIIMLSIKERINEIGILMSLGEKRIKIIGQFLVEIIVVLLVALSVSSFMGGSISKVAADKLLANELMTESQSISEQGFPGKGQQGMMRPGSAGNNFSKTKVEKIEELNVKITPLEFMKMSLLSLLVVILATIIPSLMIMRFNPKEILSKHS